MKLLSLLVFLSSVNCFAQEMGYPELNVTPKATTRIQLESKQEARHAWPNNLPIQASGLMTLVAGAMSSSSLIDDGEKRDLAPLVGMGVGAMWVGISTWMGLSYRPYKTAYGKIKKYQYKTKRQKIITERMAEEEIHSLKALGRKLRWFSVASNLIASAYLAENVEDESDAKAIAGVSAAVAILPLFFSYRWENVSEEQDKYKRKIFGPLVMAPIMFDPINQKSATGLSLNLTF
ncbi:MAG: hypothetical protein HON90_12480 [Halobacteriovoraceae bacterium]|jgi:hypothetical protein|nr:hypothetical protein [Halobacteriovoraceae bacterium]